MKIRIFHTAHYETRITENESYQTLVAIFDLEVVLFTARAVLAGSESNHVDNCHRPENYVASILLKNTAAIRGLTPGIFKQIQFSS